MPGLLLGAIQYGGYISIPKFVVFVVLFFLWLPLVGWIYADALAVRTSEIKWTTAALVAGMLGLILWTLIPVYAAGLIIFLILAGGVSLAYAFHRNTLVLEFDRVLTINHIKRLLGGKEKSLGDLHEFTFITANKNEVPLPEPNTPEFYGFKAAYDIIGDAVRYRAETILFSPTQENYKVAYSVDGVTLKRPEIERQQMDHFVHFIKQAADLKTSEKRKPQHGKFKVRWGGDTIDFELNTAGSTAGEQIKLKQNLQKDIPKIDELNLSQSQLDMLSRLTETDQGVFLVTGTPKSGVTTTFYSLIRNHDAFLNSINTLEKKPEAELPNVTQDVYSLSDTGTTTYAKKLAHLIRMGPDIVGVADCEDPQSAKLACQGAKDGKIIYVQLKAESVVKALGKWFKIAGDQKMAIESLLGISNQRLLRKLCDECKEAYEPNQKLLRKFNLPADKAKVLYRPGKVQYTRGGKPINCEHCQGTGFYGRIGIFELIVLDDELRTSVKSAKSMSEVGAKFRSAKMTSLQEQALRNVLAGKTSINEMVRVFSGSQKGA